MEQKYEHHIGIKEDKLCPFKVSVSAGAKSCPLNWHENIEVIFITDGEGRVRYGDELLSVSKDDIIVVNSGAIHCIYSDTDISYRYIIIDESFCRENGIDVSGFVFKRKLRDKGLFELFYETAERYSEYKRVKEPIFAARLRLSVLSMLVELCQRYAGVVSRTGARLSSSQEYVKCAIEYMSDHYTERISLDELSALSGVTKYHLAREFKRYTGDTVFAYVNTLRCKRAELCILDGMTVTEAAYESGFESISYFSRTYKRIMGVSPSGVKKRMNRK